MNNMKKLLLMLLTGMIISGAFAGTEHDLPVIAHWSFDNDNGGNILADSGPCHLDAGLDAKNRDVKVVTVKGISGSALLLAESAGMKFYIPNKAGKLDLKPPYTICCWIMNTKEMSSCMCIFSRKVDAGKTGYDLRIGWTMLDYRWGNGKADRILRSPKHLIALNKWYHVAVVNDGRSLKFLINAENIMEQAAGENDLVPAASPFPAVIGGYAGKEDAYQFIGIIDELYIIGKALSADELLSLANYK